MRWSSRRRRVAPCPPARRRCPTVELRRAPGPPLLYDDAARRPPSSRSTPLPRRAAARLGHRRLPRRRVPLPGLPLRRPRGRHRRRARQPRRRPDPATSRRPPATSPTRPTRASPATPPTSSSSGQADRRRARLPGHAEHGEGPATPPSSGIGIDTDRERASGRVAWPRRRRGQLAGARPLRHRLGDGRRGHRLPGGRTRTLPRRRRARSTRRRTR